MKQIYYKSTRGNEKLVKSAEAIARGLSEDGGLFVPTSIPKLNISLEELKEMDYKKLAFTIMKEFLTDYDEKDLLESIDKAYDEKFDTPVIAPLVKHGENYFLELYHGPTLAFKDMALSILPYLLKNAVKKLNINKEMVILTATSGDTGKAALEGFANVDGTKIIVFFPQEGVSEIQKRQMLTQSGDNTSVIGIEGNFDDAQNGVKKMLTDDSLIKRLDDNNKMFSSANSINIGRLIPQVVYYFYAYTQLCNKGEIKAGEEINFCVPTGNFGNILAGYYAKKMGLPIKKLICASNENKVLFDFINTGTYDRVRDFVITMSPSMDILISSNLERLLYAISGENTSKIKDLMDKLKKDGKYEIDDNMKGELKDFYGGYASEEDTAKAITAVYKTTNYVIDTHTAVSYAVYKKYLVETKDTTKTVIVSTASPYKFTPDVMKSIDSKYIGLNDFKLIKELSKLTKEDIPVGIKDLETRPILHKTVCEKNEMQIQIEKILNI
ncbi:threonine synthase [Clostridium estertheticum]|uniref:Threonine synthase n=1 Tax=Clostridium estertheticum TaxID=238834 RepID=A0A5N7IZ79_9CLOT|nr:threonine synthase [Clostridium estertheticum]MBU3185012.1 threonine synthase [Clostridium estertheticum]MPQ31072.1 threonine synthase [Clostridium estertheticum]MPQ61748.1 threonine synthase [Clostridium estertheticum]